MSSYSGAYKVYSNNERDGTAFDNDSNNYEEYSAKLRGNMIMIGSTETGKTHLAVQLIKNGLWG